MQTPPVAMFSSVNIANQDVGPTRRPFVDLRRIVPRSQRKHTFPGRVHGRNVQCWNVFAMLASATTLAVACAGIPRGATPVNLAKARDGAIEGAALFSRNCAGCHGERGESVSSAPRILGNGALPTYPPERNINADQGAGDPELLKLIAQTRPAGAPWRDPFRTAQDLYGYVSKKMPLPTAKAGSLSAEQYWAIINFMLLAHGVQVPPEGVTAANASSVKL